MIRIAFDYPLVLALTPLAFGPLFRSPFRASRAPSNDAAPTDPLSFWITIGLKICGVAAIGAVILGVAGPFRVGGEVERLGEGAEIVFLIDRSGSMNETFAGRTPAGGEESKASAAKRLLQGFVERRRNDFVGVAAFSTSPMLVMPLTDHRAATKAAIDAVDRPGLDYTNIGRGLAMALSMFKADASDRSRAILLISDGAGVIDPRIQDDLRADFKKTDVHLYWLFLRTAGSPGIYELPEAGSDTPQAAPERHLDLFFKSLGVSYRAFEAEGPEAIQAAIHQIDQLERHPVRFMESEPREDLSAPIFAVASFAILLLLIAKLSGVRLPYRGGVA
jgi:mxaC protein